MSTFVYKAATFQSFTRRIVHVLSAFGTQMSTKLEKKTERVFSHSSIFSAKFSDISRFCGYPELLNLRKINWDNSLSLMRTLWRPHDDSPSLNTLSTAALDPGTLNALSAESTHHMWTSTQASSTSTSTKYYMSGLNSIELAFYSQKRQIRLAALCGS